MISKFLKVLFFSTGLISLGILNVGCKIHKTIDFQTNNITKIEIADIRAIVTTDAQFSEIISFLESQKDEWEMPKLGTYPTPRYTLLFYEENGFVYSLYIGPKWIGTTYKEKQYIKNIENSIINDFLIKIKLKPL